jgi:peptidoglycan hydrolase-like protein with peptidoglycan-binding domain
MKLIALQTPKSLRFAPKRFVWKSLIFITTIATGLSIAPNAFAALYPGDTGREVRNLQKALGISRDGIYGSQTEQAVIRYQRSCGLQVDGVAGTETLSSIAAGNCRANRVSSSLDSGDGSLLLQPDEAGFATAGPYVVAVPGSGSDRLARVQQIVPGAVIADARGERGEYINAGGYGTRSAADRVSDRLKNNGLPARVEFRP